jgi:hypothetical protein
MERFLAELSYDSGMGSLHIRLNRNSGIKIMRIGSNLEAIWLNGLTRPATMNDQAYSRCSLAPCLMCSTSLGLLEIDMKIL